MVYLHYSTPINTNSFNVKFKFKKNSAYTPFSTYKYNLFNVK